MYDKPLHCLEFFLICAEASDMHQRPACKVMTSGGQLTATDKHD